MLTKNAFSIEFQISETLRSQFRFEAGQYVTLKFLHNNAWVEKDFSITSAPYEKYIALAVRSDLHNDAASSLWKYYKEGSEIEVSAPKGRFTISSKPHEFRTILGFASGIGITPIYSHLKNILRNEPRTRFFLFYGNKSISDTVFKDELDELMRIHHDRLQVYYFYSQQRTDNPLFHGRINDKKFSLIINQFLLLDDTDEESTIWDAVDEVLICGQGEMIKQIANSCFKNGIPKRNIHFELFSEFDEDIYPMEQNFPLIEDIQVDFKIYGQEFTTILKNNKTKLLQQLLAQNFPLPYSCKSGICGSCECQLVEGEVELLENEYLTPKEEMEGKILACMSIAMSKKLILNFDPS